MNGDGEGASRTAPLHLLGPLSSPSRSATRAAGFAGDDEGFLSAHGPARTRWPDHPPSRFRATADTSRVMTSGRPHFGQASRSAYRAVNAHLITSLPGAPPASSTMSTVC